MCAAAVALSEIASSFGASDTTFSPQFRARWVCSNERYTTLDRRQQYYECSQHDHKTFDFDGRLIKPGPSSLQPLLSTEASGYYVPLKSRRPSSPYRLCKIIVDSFTALLFSERRFPSIRVDGATDTQHFLQSICSIAKLPAKMIQARSVGGAVGASVLSWCFYNGKPRVIVHNPKHVHVHEWLDRDELIPKHASEIYWYPEDVYDSQKHQYVRRWFWFRRDWTTDAEIVFERVPYNKNADPEWTVDELRSVRHNDGVCHLIWIQNTPNSDIDGLPDCDGLYENFDAIDLTLSVLTRGTTLNLDPTLVLKMDLDYVQRMGVKKGSDNALCVGGDGDARYLELSGQSAQAGIALFQAMRKSILEVAQCVLADPDTITASGLSSVALKIIYAPMLTKCDILRKQYGEGLCRLLEQMLVVAKAREAQGEYLDLPKTHEQMQQVPGDGTLVHLAWGPYFEPTSDDYNKLVQTLVMASGNPVMSVRSAVEVCANTFGLSVDEEQHRLSTQHADEQQQQQRQQQEQEQQQQQQEQQEEQHQTDGGGLNSASKTVSEIGPPAGGV